MSEWHVTPEYIINNWTDEKLDLMVEKLIERKKRETSAIKENHTPKGNLVSPETLAARSRGMIEVVKKA